MFSGETSCSARRTRDRRIGSGHPRQKLGGSCDVKLKERRDDEGDEHAIREGKEEDAGSWKFITI
jgi:hypothetical protein